MRFRRSLGQQIRLRTPSTPTTLAAAMARGQTRRLFSRICGQCPALPLALHGARALLLTKNRIPQPGSCFAMGSASLGDGIASPAISPSCPRPDRRQSETALAVARGTARLAALARLHLHQRIAAAVRPPRRSGGARTSAARSGSSRSNPRSRIFAPTRNGRTTGSLRPAVLRHRAGSAVRDFPARHRADRRRHLRRASALRGARHRLPAATRKAMTLRFAMAAPRRGSAACSTRGGFGQRVRGREREDETTHASSDRPARRRAPRHSEKRR